MALAPGTRLGPYEVAALVGSGGMGEVYRARDTKLHREVALKVLPDVFATDADRLARFEREAHALASLNHSNIASIYGSKAQVDWRAFGSIRIGHGVRPLSGFVVVLSYSRAVFALFTVDQTTTLGRLARSAAQRDNGMHRVAADPSGSGARAR